MKIIRIHFDSLISTNTWAKENALSFNPAAITLITASEQTAGRGRFNHHWFSPKNLNLYASFCFFVDRSFPYLSQLSIFFSLMTCYSLESLQFSPKIKWPNDLLLSEKKIGGVLCETTCIENRCCVVVGIGLNINMTIEELQNIDRPASSLKIESKKNYSIDAVLEVLQNTLVSNINRFLKEGFSPFFDEYESRLNLHEGQPFSVTEMQGKKIGGTFKKLNPDGSITLELADGSQKIIYSGEISL